MTSGPNSSMAFAATSARNVSTETVMPGASRRTAPTPSATLPPLLVGGDLVGSGTRGVTSYVDPLRPFGHSLPGTCRSTASASGMRLPA